jgi:hypothetical protein
MGKPADFTSASLHNPIPKHLRQRLEREDLVPAR